MTGVRHVFKPARSAISPSRSEIAQRWDDPGLDAYLDELISHTRDGRQGFPLEVMSDLLFLSELRWWTTHSNASAGERFTFGGPAKT